MSLSGAENISVLRCAAPSTNVGLNMVQLKSPGQNKDMTPAVEVF